MSKIVMSTQILVMGIFVEWQKGYLCQQKGNLCRHKEGASYDG